MQDLKTPTFRERVGSPTSSKANTAAAVQAVVSRPSNTMLSSDNSYMFYFSLWTKNTNSFRNLLNTSKGRDKFCQLLQYTANFYVTCMKESADYGKFAKEK